MFVHPLRSSGYLLAALAAPWFSAGAASPAEPERVAPGVWMIAGGMLPGREPDGNSVIFEAPDGLIVVDTGRHEWHRARILALASARQQPIVAIINTHWHLDHVSGNPALRAAFPEARVHASDAIDGAIDGFLAKSARDAQNYIDDPQLPATLREDIRADRDTIANAAVLRPDQIVDRSGPRTPGGRPMQFNLALRAATAGDVWLYDPATRVAVLGDLVTLPAPFLDTACPPGWLAALDTVLATDFAVALPGHGAPMTHDQVRLYRDALGAFIDCACATGPAGACAADWADAVASLPGGPADGPTAAQGMAAGYVDLLRAQGSPGPHCE
jgi:glyoxylase-like metal-dependent hydrolase (beta-lactamase superfamily II)